MTQTEEGNSTIHSIGETPGGKVHHCHNNVDAGSNGGNVNQHKQTRVEIDLNSTDQLLWRFPSEVALCPLLPKYCVKSSQNV